MAEIEKILEIAINEIGYLEKSKEAYNSDSTILYDKIAGAGSDNYTKYAKELDDLSIYNGKKNGYAWCNIFVDWCFIQAVGLNRAMELLIGWSAGCTQDYNWFKSKGQVYNKTEARKGDLIFFSDLSHIGIVEYVEGSRIHTIEGNTSNKAELIINGGTVARKTYNINSSSIYGIARPNYDKEAEEPKYYQLLQRGCKGNEVRVVQQILINKGYRLPKYGADGDFGEETENAVKKLQRDSEIVVDGIVGEQTLEILQSDFVKPINEYPGYLIKKGQHSEDVRKVQSKLIELGYSCGNCGADSIFGNGTYNAVIKFQKANGLSQDGIIGINTWEKLF